MKNSAHVLVPLDSKKIKFKDIYAFDVETIRKDQNKFLMGSIVGDDFKYLSWNKSAFRKKLLSKEFKNKSIFATNLMFDFFSCFSVNEILDDKKFKYLMHNKSSNFVFVKYLPYNITFLDTINFFPVSVEELGNKLNYNKFLYPEILNKIKSIKDIKTIEDVKKLEEYNIRDSEITYRWGLWFQKVVNSLGGNMKYTIASSSMDLFKRRFLKAPIKQPSKDILTEMYNAYYGGRVETIWRGYNEGRYNYYDINGCYVAVMRKELPDLNTIKIRSRGNMDLIDMYEGISYVRLKVPDIKIPYLPYRVEKKLLFPTGVFEGWYNHFELNKAIDIGYEIQDIGKTIYFTDTEYYLRDYAEQLYNLRTEDYINQLIYKLLGNSLYGKFAQKFDMEKLKIFNLDDVDLDDEKNKELIREGKVFYNDLFLYIKNKNNFYASFILPIISLYITSYARDLLYESFIHNNEDNIFYFDTDSGITKKKIKTNKDLGGIKKEHKIKEMILVKPKQYFLKTEDDKNIIRFKGVPHRNLTLDVFVNIVNDRKMKYFEGNMVKECNYRYKKLVRFKESMRRNLIINTEIDIPKSFSLEDNKRKWGDRFDVYNFEMSEPIKINE